jgi:hypothetical protein
MAFRVLPSMVVFQKGPTGSVPSCVSSQSPSLKIELSELAASNHQSVVMPVAQRGAENTCR